MDRNHPTKFHLVIGLLFLLITTSLQATAGMERRRDQYGTDFGYYIYPIAGDIPGLGTALGMGGSAINMFGSDTDFTGFKIDGDFQASGYALLDIPIVKRRLVFDFGYYDLLVAPIIYRRGMQSKAEDYLQPKAQGDYLLGQLTYSLFDRMFDAFFRYGKGASRLIEVLDKTGEKYDAVDTSRYEVSFNAIGLTADYTDDRLDPRRGLRLEVSRRQNFFKDPMQSKYYVMDYNLSSYFPMRNWDTLAVNVFASQAHITKTGVTDADEYRARAGLNCQQIPAGPQQDQCTETENSYIADNIAHNRYGTATSLGGTQRLRSFANGRFYGGRALFYGLEYRWNITEERTPFDIYMARGIRTNFQLAAFIEQGAVADKYDDLFRHQRTSYGVGVRMLLSGVIIRADLAHGVEGNEFVLFITYPRSMFSVDSPG